KEVSTPNSKQLAEKSTDKKDTSTELYTAKSHYQEDKDSHWYEPSYWWSSYDWWYLSYWFSDYDRWHLSYWYSYSYDYCCYYYFYDFCSYFFYGHDHHHDEDSLV
ncbi:MAG: hypothetical protein JOZ19_09820, partial [Rubrobacter sp.]|nr:hypothetical protein [Rubrobacter sp.]